MTDFKTTKVKCYELRGIEKPPIEAVIVTHYMGGLRHIYCPGGCEKCKYLDVMDRRH